MEMLKRKELLLTDCICQNARWYPDKTAIIVENQRITWKEFNDRINRVANGLIEAGISKGDRVGLLNNNCAEYPEVMFGILKAGAVIVPVSSMLAGETVTLELTDVNAKAVFVGSSCLDLLEGYRKTADHVQAENYIVIDDRKNGFGFYGDFLNRGSDNEPNVPISSDDDYNIIFSSGTTGVPKGIVHTHYARAFFGTSLGIEFRIHNESITLVTTPLYTNGSQMLFLPTIVACGTVVIMTQFHPEAFLELVQKEKCTHTFMVPTQFIKIMAHSDFLKYDTSSMEVMLSAAAPLLKSTKLEILRNFPKTKLCELYGVTEGLSTILRPDEQFSKLGSVGKPSLGGDIKIIDDMGNELPRGEAGEIVGSHVRSMKGYYNKPEKTREVLWYDRQGRQFIKTGDIGKLDQEGYLYILDRKKDMIISGGINIFPSDIEEILLQHPHVLEAAVIGVPHKEWGESPLGVVVKKEGAGQVSEEEIKEWVNERLAKYQRLSAVEFRDSLPRNALEKVVKGELRAPYWKDFEE